MSSQPETYRLHRLFKFPTNGGTVPAVSFSQKDGATLISLYSTLVGLIIAQGWGLLVLFTIAFYIRKSHSRNRMALIVGIFNSQSSTISVGMLIAKYALHMKDDWRYVLLWAIFTAAAIAAGIVAPLLVSRAMLLGSVAPADVSKIWVPSKINITNAKLDKAYGLEAPAYLRAVGKVAAASDAITVTPRPSSPNSRQVDYSYQITAADFGLQILPGFKLVVKGSCRTEDNWLAPSETPTESDVYFIWNDKNKRTEISQNDGGTPFGVFWYNVDDTHETNRTWAIIVSSRGRYSYTQGNDPWYVTKPTGDPKLPHQVQRSRPALSCWETNVFELNGRTANIKTLPTLDPALDNTRGADSAASSFITMAFQAWLISTMPNKMGVSLGRMSLASSSYGFQERFDAESSSILSDMQRIVRASYFATRDMFVETTLYPNDVRTEYHNLAFSNANVPLAHLGEFVIPNSNVSALSVLVLVIVPVILGALFATLQLLKRLPATWRVDDALSGTILYSYLDHWSTSGEGAAVDIWKREDSMAYISPDKPAIIRPVWKDVKSGPMWIRTDEEGTPAHYSETISYGPNKVE